MIKLKILPSSRIISRQSAQLLNIDETGFTALVNKFIRNRISLTEKKLPFEEAKVFEENAQKGEESNFNDLTFELLHKDELQEREIARVLIEHGNKTWDETLKDCRPCFKRIAGRRPDRKWRSSQS